MQKIIQEGRAKVRIDVREKVSKEMPVFYNPVMEINRTLSVLLLNSVNKNNLKIADPLGASGIRSIRFLLELKKGKIKSISLNDHDGGFVKSVKRQLKLNKIKSKNISISNKDANMFLLESSGFDYIDIDPFGSPNHFLDNAVKRLARDGILAVTATDTSALCRTYPEACLRKYWAKPRRDSVMHETGLRILIRKVQLVGVQYDKALIPIFSYYKDHYFRAFFKCVRSKKECDKVIKKHSLFNGAGPLWTGRLWDKNLVKRIYDLALKNNDKKLHKFLEIIKNESKIDEIGFYDLHELGRENRMKNLPTNYEMIKRIKKKGYKASLTHFSPLGIRSNIDKNKLVKLMT